MSRSSRRSTGTTEEDSLGGGDPNVPGVPSNRLLMLIQMNVSFSGAHFRPKL